MDVTITNLSADAVFIPGPNLNLGATGAADDAKSWNDITMGDLDGNLRLKALVVAGTVSVAVSEDATDVAVSLQGRMSSEMLPTYTVAELALLTGLDARFAFASDGRATAEGVGVGTGVMVVFSDGDWRRQEDMAVVAA